MVNNIMDDGQVDKKEPIKRLTISGTVQRNMEERSKEHGHRSLSQTYELACELYLNLEQVISHLNIFLQR